jgi:hypothetical protein
MSTEYLQENGAEESNGDVICGLGRHLADEFTFSQITRKPSPIDKNVNGALVGTRSQGIEWRRHFRSGMPPSGQIYIFVNYTKTITDRQKLSTGILVGNRGRGMQWRRQFRSGMSCSERFYIYANYAKTVTDSQKMSNEHLQETGVGESNGDVISVLGRHLEDEFTFSKITRKPSAIDEKCQWKLLGNRGREIER